MVKKKAKAETEVAAKKPVKKDTTDADAKADEKKKPKPETEVAAKKPVKEDTVAAEVKKKSKPLEITVAKADPKAEEKKAEKKEPAAAEAKKKAPAHCVADDYGQWPDGCEAFAKVKAGDAVSIDN